MLDILFLEFHLDWRGSYLTDNCLGGTIRVGSERSHVSSLREGTYWRLRLVPAQVDISLGLGSGERTQHS